MPLTLRRMIWDDGKPSIDPEDYSVLEDGHVIGRIYRTHGTGSEGPVWLWFVSASATTIYPERGRAMSLEAAKAAFKAAWATCERRP